jgi:hypothetical protein
VAATERIADTTQRTRLERRAAAHDGRAGVPHRARVTVVAQSAAQHDAGVPLAAPSSHSSTYDGPASSTPLPHKLSMVTFTKWPSSSWTRAGMPG